MWAFSSVCGSVLIKQVLVLTLYLCCSTSWFTHIILNGNSIYALNINQRPVEADSYLFGFSVKVWYAWVFQTCETNKRKYLYPWITVLEIPDAQVTAQEVLEIPFDLSSFAFEVHSIQFVTIWTDLIIYCICRLIRRFFFSPWKCPQSHPSS